MMAKDNAKVKKESFFTRLFSRNSVVLIFSLLIAVIIWCMVTMFQTTEVEKTFQDIPIPLNFEGSMAENNSLRIFGEKTYDVDVTLKGMSYILNDPNFANDITASVSFSSVSAPGTYNLPVTVTVAASSVEVVMQSRNSITVEFDETSEKNFPLIEEVRESEDYTLPEGYALENPRLSVEKVTLIGPQQEMSKITEVHAVAELSGEVTENQVLEAKLVLYAGEEEFTSEYIEILNEDPVYVTIPVSVTGTYKTAVTFTNIPKAYRDGGFEYTVYPASVSVTSSSADQTLAKSKEISVGSIDFSQLNNEDNVFTFDAADLGYTIEGVTRFTVHVDMSAFSKRWLTVNVSTEGLSLPNNAKLEETSISSIQLIGPSSTVMKIEDSEAYAVPVLDGVRWETGVNTVPVKIVLRTLTDSWVRGEYTAKIRVGS